MLIGVGVMFACTVSATLPQMVSLPVDTFSCLVNAVCLYYMLYRRRLVPLRSFASNGPVFAIALTCATVLLISVYRTADNFYDLYFSKFMPYKTIVFSVAASVLTVLLFCIVRRLMTAILLKGAEQQNEELRQFSTDVNKTLSLEACCACTGITCSIPCPATPPGSLCWKAAPAVMRCGTHRNVGGLPGQLCRRRSLMAWLKTRGSCSQYSEFTRSRHFRALWQKEKDRLEQMRVELLLPIMSGGEMTAVTCFPPG